MRNLTSVDQLEFGPEKIRLKPPNPLAWRLLVSRKVLGDSASRKIAIRRCKADHHPQLKHLCGCCAGAPRQVEMQQLWAPDLLKPAASDTVNA
jgi:hypothetical protein